MNFQDLLTKLTALEENVDQSVEECGGMMSSPSIPKQSDSVTMNVSMNGSGKGGIRDLLDVLSNIDNVVAAPDEPEHSHSDKLDVLVGDSINDGKFGDATTEPNEVTLDIDSITDIGHPINSGDHRPRQAGLPVGNPMSETLVNHLSNLYNEVKNR